MTRLLIDELHYTQSSVANTFRDGLSIHNPGYHVHEPIRVVIYKEATYILDNRTTVAKELAGHKRTHVIYV